MKGAFKRTLRTILAIKGAFKRTLGTILAIKGAFKRTLGTILAPKTTPRHPGSDQNRSEMGPRQPQEKPKTPEKGHHFGPSIF